MKGYTMEEETTTNAPVSDGGSINGIAVDDQGQALVADEPQPDQPEPAEAEDKPVEPSQEAPKEDEPAKADNSTTAWLEAKGIDPKSPEAIEKVAEMARNAEKAMHQKAQKASELEKVAKISDEEIPVDATPEVRDNVRVRNLELKFDVQQWKVQNPDKVAHEAEMVKVLADPTKKALVQEGYLSLDDVYSIARGGDVEATKSQGKREALETLAQKQQAAVPVGNAVNPSGSASASKITPQNVDQLVKGMSVQEYQKRLPEINAALN